MILGLENRKEVVCNDKIMLQLSSGQGPLECEAAVAKFFRELWFEYPEIILIDYVEGNRSGCYKSIRFYGSSEKMQELEGTIQWICKSPFRPNHKRKNWYIDVSILFDINGEQFNEKNIRYESFRSSGKGGQNVNKRDTAIRAIYMPTGDSVVIMEERSQYQNKKIAMSKLSEVVSKKNKEEQDSVKSQNRLEHYKIERGNPLRVYEGEDFKRRE